MIASMQSVLLVIHLLVVIVLVAVVLLQRSEGGVLGTGGGGGGFMTGRGQANALSRATAVLGTLFFVTAILMSILASWSRAPRSMLETARRLDQARRPNPLRPGEPARSTQADAEPKAGAPRLPLPRRRPPRA